MNSTQIVARIDELLNTPLPNDSEQSTAASIVQCHQATLTLLYAVHGPGSRHFDLLKDADAEARRYAARAYGLTEALWPVLQGTLRSLKGDIEGGVVGDLRRQAVGEVLADMLGLAREALRDTTEGAKNVAAVLTAAAFEDTIRKMGSAFAGVDDRRDLSDVLAALKKADVIVGAPLTTALGYLKFRNDALHADWGKIDQPVVSSCLAFVEGLILKHLS